MENKGCGKIINIHFPQLGDVSSPCGQECITDVPGKFSMYFCNDCKKNNVKVLEGEQNG